MAEVPALSPLPALPPKPALSALLVGAAAMAPTVTPPEAEDPQWEDVILPSRQSQVDHHEDAQYAQVDPTPLEIDDLQ